MNWQEEYDVIVAGSGAGGIISAITAANHGLKTIIIEKADVWGRFFGTFRRGLVDSK